MPFTNLDGLPCWYVIQTKPRQEDRAVCNLHVWGIETFSPRFKEFRQQRLGVAVFSIKHLFPQYIFARFDLGSLLHRVSFTRGVHGVVRFGGEAVPVADEMIGIMQTQAGEDGFIRIGEDFKHGDKVLIKEGPFENFIGIFEREIKESDRVRILLTTVNFQGHVTVERMRVKNVSASVPAGKTQAGYSNSAA